MEKVIGHLFSGKHPIIVVTLFVIMGLMNVVCMESYANLLLTFPQVLFVLYLLMIRNDVEDALLFHVIFCLTGFDATSGSTELQLMSYPEIKLVGPLTLSYIILGLIWLRVVKKKIPKSTQQTLLYQFRKVVILMMGYGMLVGLFGLCFLGYRFSDFILPSVYIVTGFLFLDILIRLLDSSFLKKCHYCMLYLLIAAPPVAFISFFLLGIRADYSGLDALLFNEAFMLAPTLIIAFFYKGSHKLFFMFSLLLYFLCVMSAGRGGFFLNIAASLVFVVYLVYFAGETKHSFAAKVSKVTIPFIFVALISYISTMDVGLNLGTRKLSELVSLFEAFGTLSATGVDISVVSASPYIRIAEILNILDNGLHNIFGLILGYGYGGYYTDSTHLFQNVDVSNGGFSMDVIRSGRYGTAHSFLPMILLYNGLYGLFLIVRLGFRYFKKVMFSPLVFAAFTLFFYSFYFNTSLFMATSFSLFAAEWKIKYS